MKHLTKQEIFDLVRDHLITQGEKSYSKDAVFGNGCLYRDGKGNACAVGCLIPNSSYRKSMEAKTVGELFAVFPGCMPQITIDDIPLLAALQEVHDNNNSFFWVKQLKSVCENFELEW